MSGDTATLSSKKGTWPASQVGPRNVLSWCGLENDNEAADKLSREAAWDGSVASEPGVCCALRKICRCSWVISLAILRNSKCQPIKPSRRGAQDKVRTCRRVAIRLNFISNRHWYSFCAHLEHGSGAFLGASQATFAWRHAVQDFGFPTMMGGDVVNEKHSEKSTRLGSANVKEDPRLRTCILRIAQFGFTRNPQVKTREVVDPESGITWRSLWAIMSILAEHSLQHTR